MTREYSVRNGVLRVPVFLNNEERSLTVCSHAKVLFDITVGSPKGSEKPDRFVDLPVFCGEGEKLEISGDLPESFFDLIGTEGALLPVMNLSSRPKIHFTPEFGWMNDPNGLLFAGGVFHMYFQHNPLGLDWGNMSWGHTVSRDLLHWEQRCDVLFPDEYGMIFSGSGIVSEKPLPGLPENSLIFFYTAAANTPSCKTDAFFQRRAVSADGGNSLKKDEEAAVFPIEKENRDPKVFWHGASGAYIMCLWLRDNEFALLRSSDLKTWSISSRLTLPGGYECPDMFELQVEGSNEKKWVFWSADGYWYTGAFDGYNFEPDGFRGSAYVGGIPYAAQTFSGLKDRVVSVSWLRVPNKNRFCTGAMSIPRELSLVKQNSRLCLKMKPVREYDSIKKLVWRGFGSLPSEIPAVSPENVLEINTRLRRRCGITTWSLGPLSVVYDPENGVISVDKKEVQIGTALDFSFIIDRDIFEMTADAGTIYAVFDIAPPDEPFFPGITAKELEDMSIYVIE